MRTSINCIENNDYNIEHGIYLKEQQHLLQPIQNILADKVVTSMMYLLENQIIFSQFMKLRFQ